MSAPTSTAPDTAGPPAPAGLPTAFWLWLIGTGVSLLGTQVLAFGMAWAAAGSSGFLAGAVLTAVVLPRVLLGLLGGATADRVGPRRVMLVGDAVMLALTSALVLGFSAAGPSAVLLLGAACAIGIVDAFYLPASGAMPRQLVAGPGLARALAARQLAGQLALFAGAPLGGLLVAFAGLPAAALFDAGTFAVMLVVLLALRRSGPPPVAPASGPHPTGALAGLRVVRADRALRLCLLLVLAAAALLLPVSSLLVPVLGRSRGWAAGTAGSVVGAVALGTAAVAVAVLLRSASSRPGVAGPGGLLLAAVGVAGLVLPGPAVLAVASGAVIGLGTGLFTAHVGPLVLGRAPVTHVARIQAVLLLAQSLPLLASTPLLGLLSDGVGAVPALLGAAVVLSAVACAALASPVLRRAT